MKKTLNFLSWDVETTALDSCEGLLLSFGAVYEDERGKLADQPKFEYLFYHENIRGTAGAINMNLKLIERITFEQLKLKRCEREVVEDNGNTRSVIGNEEDFTAHFLEWLELVCEYPIKDKRITFAGKNLAIFDMKWMESHTDFITRVPHHHRVLDVGSMYYEGGDVVPSLGDINELTKKLGGVAHDAIEDAVDVVRAIRISLGRRI